jgi:UDPglucose 6-dehydrogenase
LTVIGTGYLGTTHAACMAALGYEVLGYDSDIEKITTLRAGKVPFYEPGLDELLTSGIASGRLRFTHDLAQVADFGDVHFICVGTPQRTDGMAADTSYLYAAIDELAPLLRRRCLVVGKCTVPVGTAVELSRRLTSCAPAEVELVWNPEFLREGLAVSDTLRPDRIVFGLSTAVKASSAVEANAAAEDDAAAEKSSTWVRQQLRTAYAGVLDLATHEHRELPVVITDFATAELAKVAANAFLATKISFINAMAEMCEVSGGNVNSLADILGHDQRIGSRFLRAGVGFGGGCLPKDIRAFAARADELGVSSVVRILAEVDTINLRRRTRVVDLARELCGGELAGARVCVLGAAFKPHSDDVRDSPALWIAQRLHDAGAQVSIYDPQAVDNARRKLPVVHYCGSTIDAVRDADIVLILTEWPEFANATPQDWAGAVAHRRILDGRSCLDAASWTAAGWRYQALGT